MRRITIWLVALAAIGSIVASFAPKSRATPQGDAPTFLTKIPPEYRDWKVISVAHEEGNLNSLGAILGQRCSY